MSRKKRRRSRSSVRWWPALLGLAVAAGVLAATYYGITRLLAGVTPVAETSIDGLERLDMSQTPEVLPMAEGSEAFFGDLPADYAFRIKADGQSAEDVPALVALDAGDGLPLGCQVTRLQSSFEVTPSGGDYQSGGTYRITLSDPAVFVAENLRPYRTIYFSIAREDVGQLSFQKTVVLLDRRDVLQDNGQTLLLSPASCKAGNILILPATGTSPRRAARAVSVTESLDGLQVSLAEPDLSEVLRSFAFSGRFALKTGEAVITPTSQEGLEVEDLSSGGTLKLRATFSLPGRPDCSLILTYEDQPEFLIDLNDDGAVAFRVISSGQTTLEFQNQADGGLCASAAGLSRPELASALQAIMTAENAGLVQQNTPLLTLQVCPDESPLAVDLSVELDLSASFQGCLSGYLSERHASMAGVRAFGDQALAYGSSAPAILNGRCETLGRGSVEAAVTLRADLSLLQFARASLAAQHSLHAASGGSVSLGQVTTGDLADPGASITGGYYEADTAIQLSGALAARIASGKIAEENLDCVLAANAALGPWGTRLLPVAVVADVPALTDEAGLSAVLPAISLQVLNLEGGQMELVPADPSALLFLLDRSQLFLSDGQLQVPAGLTPGDYNVEVSLSGQPDVKGSLLLTKVRPLLSADLSQIAHLLTLHKAEALALLGSAYTVGPAGADGWMDGYHYDATGLTLCFYPEGMQADPGQGINEDDLDRVVYIYCESQTDINGARAGMTPAEIAALLGEPSESFPATDYFQMDVFRYILGGLEINFASPGSGQATAYAFITLDG